jgi:putative membrane protein
MEPREMGTLLQNEAEIKGKIFESHMPESKEAIEMGIIVRLVINSLAVLLASKIVTGIYVQSWGTALLAALVLGLINLIIRPLIMLLTLPINIVTLGLFSLVVNAILFWLTGALIRGFDVNGFVPAFLGALIVAVASWIADRIMD